LRENVKADPNAVNLPRRRRDSTCLCFLWHSERFNDGFEIRDSRFVNRKLSADVTF
jgi:hypothetical protein